MVEAVPTEETTDAVPYPVVSIIMPTYNRLARLKSALAALAGQSVEPGCFEVIVVSDGSTDGTDEYLASGETPLPVIGLSQLNAGPAAARNLGVSAASAPLVLFVDDDIMATPTLVERHLRAHAGDVNRAVIGPMLNAPDFTYTPWVAWEQAMLEKQYSAMRKGEFEPTFHQFYTGNASVARSKFNEVGGFKPGLRRAEDTEFAFRLSEVGVHFVFDQDAAGLHYADRSYESWAESAAIDGRNMIALVRDSGQTWRLRAMAHGHANRHVLTRGLVSVCTPCPPLARVAIAGLRSISLVSSRLSMNAVSTMALSGVNALCYSLAAADEFGGASALRAAVRSAVLQPGYRDGSAKPARVQVGFVLEQTLGHVTHSDNLQQLLPADERIAAEFHLIPFTIDDWRARLPFFSNWTIRAGVRTRRVIVAMHRRTAPAVLFIHTQVLAMFAVRWMSKIPTIVSIDATPIQYDQFGLQYGHEAGSALSEKLKWALHRRCFRRADQLISWSEWSKQSLVDDYDVPAARISVLAPGVNLAKWSKPPGRMVADGAVRVLFVGGDLDRKGGRQLLEAVGRLNECGADGRSGVELHMVTNAQVDPQDHVFVHRGLTPNASEIIALYHAADIFCLPTLADCLPMVLSEAGAAGLPLVTTSVGAIPEIAIDGRTGLLVTPGDVAELTAALQRLIDDPELRRRLGANARALVADKYDAAKNARVLGRIIVEVAQRHAIVSI